jgi:hypothetical protein
VGGLSEAPKPRTSTAIARKPAPARAGITPRQLHQKPGKPWTSRTAGPSPASTRWKRAPLAATKRCSHGPGRRRASPGVIADPRSGRAQSGRAQAADLTAATVFWASVMAFSGLGFAAEMAFLPSSARTPATREKQQGHNAERQRARQPDIEHEPERQEQEDQPEEADERRTGEHAGTLPGDLDATGDLGFGQSDVVVDERGDVARRVGDELADRALILDRGASHGHTLAVQGDGTIW